MLVKLNVKKLVYMVRVVVHSTPSVNALLATQQQEAHQYGGLFAFLLSSPLRE
jgi:hypothetical protein